MGTLLGCRLGERGGVGDEPGKYLVNVAARSSQNWAADS